MRTTLDLEAAALQAARELAAHRGQSLGKVVSELVLKGLRSDLPAARRGGFPVFAAGAKPITLDDIKQAEDEA
jgi:hypothetical protein